MIELQLWQLLAIALSCVFLPLCVFYIHRFVQILRSARGTHELFSANIANLEQIVRAGLRDLAQETADLRKQQQQGSKSESPTLPADFRPEAFGRSPLDVLPSVDEAVRRVMEAQNTELRIVQSDEADPAQRKRRLLVSRARKMCKPESCCNCKWWDHEGGQAAIAQTNQVFLKAAQHILPNVMGRVIEYDDAGKELPPDPSKQYPAVLNTWELFGACVLQNIGHHAIDTCDEFEAV